MEGEVLQPYYDHWAFHPLLKLMKAVPISAGREGLASIEQARRELQDGHVVCIFAEGSISRTGNMLPFKRGFERIVEDLDVPIVPVYLDRVWGSVFSFKGGRFFWKWPVRIPYPVTIAFGAPLPSSTTAAGARLALQTLGSELAADRRPPLRLRLGLRLRPAPALRPQTAKRDPKRQKPPRGSPARGASLTTMSKVRVSQAREKLFIWSRPRRKQT
jgi:hypothetical protein